MSSSDQEVQAVPQGVTIKVTEKAHHRVTGSQDSGATSSSNGVSNDNNVPSVPQTPTALSPRKSEAKEEQGVEMSTEELLSHRTSSLFISLLF